MAKRDLNFPVIYSYINQEQLQLGDKAYWWKWRENQIQGTEMVTGISKWSSLRGRWNYLKMLLLIVYWMKIGFVQTSTYFFFWSLFFYYIVDSWSQECSCKHCILSECKSMFSENTHFELKDLRTLWKPISNYTHQRMEMRLWNTL